MQTSSKQKKVVDSKPKAEGTPKVKAAKAGSPRHKSESGKTKPDSMKKSDTAKTKIDASKALKIDLKSKKEDTKAVFSACKSSASSKTSSAGGKKERRRSADERKTLSSSDARKRLPSAPAQTPVTSWQWEGQPELKPNRFVQVRVSL